jgi:hypothetical protein
LSVKVHGYGADAEFEGSNLRVTATGKMGRGALGTDVRDIDVSQLKALSFKPGNVAINGRLELVDERGKSVIHFRRKGNNEWQSLYERIVELAPAGANEVPTDDAPLFSEDAEKAIAPLRAWAEKKAAEQEAKEAAKTAAKQAKSDVPSSPSAVAGSADIADEIRSLGRLRDEGLITDEEFETKRAELLARM